LNVRICSLQRGEGGFSKGKIDNSAFGRGDNREREGKKWTPWFLSFLFFAFTLFFYFFSSFNFLVLFKSKEFQWAFFYQ
jgi:hypothetical protein